MKCPKCDSDNTTYLYCISMDMIPPILSEVYRCNCCKEEFWKDISEKDSVNES